MAGTPARLSGIGPDTPVHSSAHLLRGALRIAAGHDGAALRVRLGRGGIGAGAGLAPKGALAAVHDAPVGRHPPGVEVGRAIRVRHAGSIAGRLCVHCNADGLRRAPVATRGGSSGADLSCSSRDRAGREGGRGGNSCAGRKGAAEPDPGRRKAFSGLTRGQSQPAGSYTRGLRPFLRNPGRAALVLRPGDSSSIMIGRASALTLNPP